MGNVLRFQGFRKNESEVVNMNYRMERPNPQFEREHWMNLNGEWELNGKKIIVPFPPESKASKYVGRKSSKWGYKKIFTIPKDFIKERVILHFGAVDQIANVFVDDKFNIQKVMLEGEIVC